MRTLSTQRSNPWSFFNNEIFKLLDEASDPTQFQKRAIHSEFPKYDVEENEKNFKLSFDLPGVKKDDLSIEVKDGLVTISGERKNESKAESYSGRFHGTFERSFSLPDNINTDAIEAHYEDGVLHLALPKMEPKVGRKIEIGQTRKVESAA